MYPFHFKGTEQAYKQLLINNIPITEPESQIIIGDFYGDEPSLSNLYLSTMSTFLFFSYSMFLKGLHHPEEKV